MSVTVELRVVEEVFELGRVLQSAEPLDIELETMVPLRERPVPLFLVHDGVGEAFETSVTRHPSVDGIDEIERHDGGVLYALEWDVSRDSFFESIREAGGQLLAGRRTRSTAR